MNFIPVDNVPRVRNANHNLQDFIQKFIDSDLKEVKIIFTDRDYKSPWVCYSCIRNGIRRSGHHTITALKRGDDVYLVKI